MASLNKVLKAALADTPLVQNLKNEEYMNLILDGCANLAERFSKIDVHLARKEMAKASKNTNPILPKIKNMVKDVELIEKVSTLFSTSPAK